VTTLVKAATSSSIFIASSILEGHGSQCSSRHCKS
jgi:hypothetical protein